MDEYSLNDVGYKFYTSSEEDCFNAFEQAVVNKEWVVVPLWKPQFLHHQYTIREIVAALDYQVSREGKSLDEVTKTWLTEQKNNNLVLS